MSRRLACWVLAAGCGPPPLALETHPTPNVGYTLDVTLTLSDFDGYAYAFYQANFQIDSSDCAGGDACYCPILRESWSSGGGVEEGDALVYAFDEWAFGHVDFWDDPGGCPKVGEGTHARQWGTPELLVRGDALWLRDGDDLVPALSTDLYDEVTWEDQVSSSRSYGGIVPGKSGAKSWTGRAQYRYDPSLR